jgi:transcriptional regulator
MHILKKFNMPDMAEKHAFVNKFGFGVIVSGSLTGTHLPFYLRADEGVAGTLYSHCSRANPHWKELDGAEVLVIFSGPHSYISPSWYSQSPAVPTWNYASVHAYGVVSLLDKEQTIEAVENITSKYEPELLITKDILTDAYRDKLLSGIVGFKVELSHLEGQSKIGQNRKKQDQVQVFDALSNSTNLDSLALANYMRPFM